MTSTQGSGNMKPEFVLDMEAIRRQAREHLNEGAVTDAYKGSRDTVVQLLNDALATELVCVLRYKRHYFMSASLGGIAGFAVTSELAQHVTEEQQHADKLAQRIVQLGGEPNFDPKGLATRSHAEYVSGSNLEEMLRDDLIAERIAIETYSETIRYIGSKDPTTRRLLEEILEQEEEHADDLRDFLNRLGATPLK